MNLFHRTKTCLLNYLLNWWNKIVQIVTNKKFVFWSVIVLLICSFMTGIFISYSTVKTELAWKQYIYESREETKKEYISNGVRFIMNAYKCDSLIIYNTVMETFNPILMTALIAQESRFNPNAISPVGALGLCQIMPYNLEKGSNWKDPRTNILRAEKLFKEHLKSCGGNEVLALASYNAGLGRVIKAGWKVPDTKNNETKLYVQKITSLVNEAKDNSNKIYY
jgi:hypothetical protein